MHQKLIWMMEVKLNRKTEKMVITLEKWWEFLWSWINEIDNFIISIQYNVEGFGETFSWLLLHNIETHKAMDTSQINPAVIIQMEGHQATDGSDILVCDVGEPFQKVKSYLIYLGD